jgi:translation elongation factor EF-1alpha
MIVLDAPGQRLHKKTQLQACLRLPLLFSLPVRVGQLEADISKNGQTLEHVILVYILDVKQVNFVTKMDSIVKRYKSAPTLRKLATTRV